MFRWLEHRALALYPHAFRARYGREMRSLVDDSPAGPAKLVNLLSGAAKQHLHPDPTLAETVPPGWRTALSIRFVLIAWLVFVLAGLGFYKTTENDGALATVQHSAFLSQSHLIVQILAPLAGLAISGAFVAYIRAERRIRRGELTDRSELRLGVMAVTFAAVSMLAMALATAVYSVALSIQAPALADALDGPLQANSASVSIDMQFALMIVCCVPALVAVRRARRNLAAA